LAKKYKDILKTREIGIHAHNNQQLAFANTIESIINNINYLEITRVMTGELMKDDKADDLARKSIDS